MWAFFKNLSVFVSGYFWFFSETTIRPKLFGEVPKWSEKYNCIKYGEKNWLFCVWISLNCVFCIEIGQKQAVHKKGCKIAKLVFFVKKIVHTKQARKNAYLQPYSRLVPKKSCWDWTKNNYNQTFKKNGLSRDLSSSVTECS